MAGSRSKNSSAGEVLVFITGATGFIGSHIARKIIKDGNKKVILLVRAEDDDSALRRIYKEWWDWNDITKEAINCMEVIAGDVCRPYLGMGIEKYNRLTSSVTHIIHAAAETRIDTPVEELMRVNVEGVRNIISFAEDTNNNGKFARLSHISTAYVCGRKGGSIAEDILSDAGGFISEYELSKYMGELLAKEAMYRLPVTIFRPSMVIGDSRTGEIKTFNTIYYPLRLYLNGVLKIFPLRADARVDLIPVDYVAGSVAGLTFDSNAKDLIFHLTCPVNSQPTLKELSDYTEVWVKKNMNMKLASPLFFPLGPSIVKLWYGLARKANREKMTGKTTKNILSLLEYFYIKRHFIRENTDRLSGAYRFDWKDFFGKILEFAIYNGFLHRSGRTVHEQILFRLGSRSRKINYYDVVDGRFNHRSPEELRDEILAAANAMIDLGIRPGDRVALVGYNSTEYLSIDTAIGLIGAVSVPLYYTSTPEMINDVLKECDAKIIFIGRKHYMESLDVIVKDLDKKQKIQVVTFLKDNNPDIDLNIKNNNSPANRDRFKNKDDNIDRVIAWDDFLSIGRNRAAFKDNFEQFGLPGNTATLRYSSGTTGKPKGVIFDHYNLRWMAESLNSLFPWKARNSKVIYLSFLPLNHVVEGILSNYSLYYTPAPVDIYFLKDFRLLGKILPVVKPTAFFSVPRYYEKVYESFSFSGIGRTYDRLPGILKRVIRPLVRYVILKRAGLNRCVQLIVGSAPISTELLLWYRSIGIQVHNAYGLTEAPLVTLNRLGKNRIGTVGQPLPETEISILDDSEIVVRGPQVTRGYFKKSKPEQPFIHDKKTEKSFLLTGDIGILDEEGYLEIRDRKKDIIITSYGKNIQPLYIESKIKAAPAVTEAIIIGNEKPYCSAIIWLQGNKYHDFIRLDKQMRYLNRSLSDPAEVKRWVFLEYDLSIEKGLLTPNLKLRRGAVAEHYKDLIRLIYNTKNTRDFDNLNRELSEAEKTASSGSRDDILNGLEVKEKILHFGYLPDTDYRADIFKDDTGSKTVRSRGA